MIRNVGVHRADEADVIRAFTHVREQLADIHAALAVFLELERRLHQLAGAPLRFDGSAGQGLAIAHNVIVKKHGGRISFETEAGRGTTFIISLPLGASAGLEERAS